MTMVSADGEGARILVIKLGALGDFILALDAMAAIHAHHPDAHITLMTTRPFVDLARQSGYFDQIWEVERYKWYEPLRWMGLAHRLRTGGFTRVYDLQYNDRTAIMFALSTATMKKHWSGIIKGSDLFYNNPDRMQLHAYERHREALKIAGIADTPAADMGWMDGDVSYFPVPKTYALIVAGSAPSRPDKRWPAKRYGALCQKLLQDGITPVLLGTPAEEDVITRIKKICPHAIDLGGQTTLFEIAALARGATCAIGNDTGPMHIIAAAGCPSLTLFSLDSDPKKSAPRGHKTVVLQSDDLNDLTVTDIYKTLSEQEMLHGRLHP